MTKGTILVVDDDAAIGDLLVDLLSDEVYTVAYARSGAEALGLLEQYQPPSEHWCLVLLDMMMPQANGLEVLQHLAARNYYVPVVAMSAVAGHLLLAQRAGAKATIEKPLDLERLLAVVERNRGKR